MALSNQSADTPDKMPKKGPAANTPRADGNKPKTVPQQVGRTAPSNPARG